MPIQQEYPSEETLVHVLMQVHDRHGIAAVEVYEDIDDARAAKEEAQAELDEYDITDEYLRLETDVVVR